ncbi:unnamed protein product, partial [marine sediment metagenome]
INHTNAPVEFIPDIGDKKGISVNYALEIDLKTHFFDVDYYDNYYNQTVEFEILSDGVVIQTSEVSDDWIFFASSSSSVTEIFNITGYDLNESGDRLTNITSNNFTIEFVPATVVSVPAPSSGGGGGGSSQIISLKIIMPGQISVYEGEKIEIPLKLVNRGSTTFNGLVLNSSALKQGEVIEEIQTSLDKTYFKSLGAGKEENLNLSVFFDTGVLGDYEILVEVKSKSPSYKDWGKIHVSLQAINESQVRDLFIFTEEFIVGNPQCIEISEIIKEAEKYLQAGDYVNAKQKTEQALNSCKEAISQVSFPRLRVPYFKTSLYLILSIMLAIVAGLVYYFIRRKRLQNRYDEIKNKLRTGKALID